MCITPLIKRTNAWRNAKDKLYYSVKCQLKTPPMHGEMKKTNYSMR